ncbi:hypothetical protein CEB3_c18740 [Peptococcaceae bacterium CEB3]|nr:hypothetical protein CEB3_c18740 [Peptococcaceae bacterium CEB3]
MIDQKAIKTIEQELSLCASTWASKKYDPSWVKFSPEFSAVIDSIFEYIVNTPRFRQFQREINQIENIKKEIRKKKVMIRDERVKRAVLEKKLAAAHCEIKELEDQQVRLKQTIADLKAAPARSQEKLENFKALISDMRAEIKRLQPKNEDLPPAAELEDSVAGDGEEPSPDTWELLTTKKIGIIGGYRGKNVFRDKYPNVTTMTGRENLSEYEGFIKACDIIVVLTEHIGHHAMWTAKALCAEYNKPIVYSRHTNLVAIGRDVAYA